MLIVNLFDVMGILGRGLQKRNAKRIRKRLPVIITQTNGYQPVQHQHGSEMDFNFIYCFEKIGKLPHDFLGSQITLVAHQKLADII